MLPFLLFVLILAAAVYVGWRVMRARASRPKTRVIGPDDDPEFLWRLGRDDTTPPPN